MLHLVGYGKDSKMMTVQDPFQAKVDIIHSFSGVSSLLFLNYPVLLQYCIMLFFNSCLLLEICFSNCINILNFQVQDESEFKVTAVILHHGDKEKENQQLVSIFTKQNYVLVFSCLHQYIYIFFKAIMNKNFCFIFYDSI